jgi:hypothetical protein
MKLACVILPLLRTQPRTPAIQKEPSMQRNCLDMLECPGQRCRPESLTKHILTRRDLMTFLLSAATTLVQGDLVSRQLAESPDP